MVSDQSEAAAVTIRIQLMQLRAILPSEGLWDYPDYHNLMEVWRYVYIAGLIRAELRPRDLEISVDSPR